MFSVAHNEVVDLKCQRNERHGVTVTFLALKRECHDNVLDSVHFSAVTTCQHASDMFIRDDVTCGSLLTSSLTFPFHRPFVGPLCSHAKATDTAVDLVPGESRMRTCNYLDTLSSCRNYVISGNREHRSESQLVHLGPRARKVFSRVAICSRMIEADVLYSRIIVTFFN